MIEATGASAVTALSNDSNSINFTDSYSQESEQQFRNAVDKSEHCDPSSTSQCMGNTILEGVQQLKSGYDEKVTAINDTVNIGQLTVQDVMVLQLEIAKLQMQEELMAKTASKTTQNVDTLLKSQ
ncbi:MAG: type III secretion system YscI/HrpB-like protein [Psychrobacter glaciei]|jgi:type III secretion system YscI/HrpB-like protein